MSNHLKAQKLKDVIFIGGLEKVCSLKRQVELFQIGYGTPEKLISFRYNTNTKEIINTIKSNKQAIIVLFSAGCQKSRELLLTNGIEHKSIYLIEPYGPNESLTFVLEYTKFPTKNIFVGNSKDRGLGIVKNTSSSGSKYHCESLTTSAVIIKSRF